MKYGKKIARVIRIFKAFLGYH